jgi:thiol:disulfide interchange protein DsbD
MSRPVARTLICGLLALPAFLPVHAGFFDRSHDEGVLPVDEALRLQPVLPGKDRLLLGWDVAPGCYLYRDKLGVEILDPLPVRAAALTLPAGEQYRDAHFGEVRVLRGSVQAALPLGDTPAPRRLRVRYQGCAEDKVCYPPQTREIEVPRP